MTISNQFLEKIEQHRQAIRSEKEQRLAESKKERYELLGKQIDEMKEIAARELGEWILAWDIDIYAPMYSTYFATLKVIQTRNCLSIAIPKGDLRSASSFSAGMAHLMIFLAN